jgi:hypothetical protein
VRKPGKPPADKPSGDKPGSLDIDKSNPFK